jgi:hypothetical protein
MKRSFWLAFALPSLAAMLLAQPAWETSPRASIDEAASTIRVELERHGDRVLGHETYRWSTRLEKFADCRVEFSVRVTSNFGEPSVRVESVNFSLGALEPYGIAVQKKGLELPCAGKEKCIFSISTCSKKSKEGIVTDCATASQRREEYFALQFDGDAAAASRLERAFREAANHCREPQSVNF